MRRIIAGSIVAGALLLAAGNGRAEESLAGGVRKACNKELTTFCKGVPEGEGRVLACLYAFEAKVSDKCAYAVYDAASQLEQAATALKYAANACKADFEKYCAEVKPGEGRGLKCIQKNEKQVSAECKEALTQTGIKKK